MKKIKYLIISFIALMPLGPISVAAQSSLLDHQENPEESDFNWSIIMKEKTKIFPPFGTSVHIDEAREIFRRKTNIEDPILFEKEFRKTIRSLSDKGILQKKDLILRSGAPSDGAAF